MNYFKNAEFFTTVNHLQDLPDTSIEIVSVGRSNAGKSNAVNTLTQHTRLAYVSEAPERTQHISFLELKNDGFMVDLPGYGYTQVPEAVRTHWIQLLGGYLQRQSQPIGLILIMDARHPLEDSNICILDLFHTTGRPARILLSKANKLLKNEQIKTPTSVDKSLKSYKERQRVSIQLFSNLKKQGIEEVNRIIGEWSEARIQETENTQFSTIPPTP